MSETDLTPSVTPIHPGALNADDLITYEAFGWLLPAGLDRRKFERQARLGHAPAGVRYSPRSKMVWRAGAISAWLNQKDAAMDAKSVVDTAGIEALVAAAFSREGGQ